MKKRIALSVSLFAVMALLIVTGIAFVSYPVASLETDNIESALMRLGAPIEEIRRVHTHGTSSEPINQVTFLANDRRGTHLYLARLKRGWFGRYRFLSISHADSPLIYASREPLEGREGILVVGINPDRKADFIVMLSGDNEFRISLKDKTEFCIWYQNMNEVPTFRFLDSSGQDITAELGDIQPDGGGGITQERVTWVHVLAFAIPAAPIVYGLMQIIRGLSRRHRR